MRLAQNLRGDPEALKVQSLVSYVGPKPTPKDYSRWQDNPRSQGKHDLRLRVGYYK